MTDKLTIATRGSALALWQANHVKARLEAVQDGLTVELSVIKTSGDAIQDVPLANLGGKGLFVKEIEEALLARRADLAVHSMKDVPAELAPGLVIAAVSVREDPRDALCARASTTLDALPRGARIGTSSLRRQCQLLARRPDLHVAVLRGNVPTRLAKLDAGEFDAVVLAAAGLLRLGLGSRITELLPPEVSMPAVAQGVLAIETREHDARACDLARAAIHDEPTARRIAAERAFLARMGGSCQTPLAAHAVDSDGRLRVVGMCGAPDGSRVLRAEATGSVDCAAELGVKVAEELLAMGASEILAATGA
jgi:hydroxymethylbilane synthase